MRNALLSINFSLKTEILILQLFFQLITTFRSDVNLSFKNFLLLLSHHSVVQLIN